MFAEVQKLKNSGGEWKLLEKRLDWTPGEGMPDYSKREFIISNGIKKIDMVYEADFPDPDLTAFLSTEEEKELRKIFSENNTPFLNRKSKLGQSFTVKNFNKSKEVIRTCRFLSAWSITDVFKILVDYYQANKTEIGQYNQKNQVDVGEKFISAPWLEVGEDDKLFYIWVGERDMEKGFYQGGGELEISLKKSDLIGKYENGSKMKDFSGPEGMTELKSILNCHWRFLTSILIDEQEGRGKFEDDSLTLYYENIQVGFNGDDSAAWLENENYNLPENWSSKPPTPIKGSKPTKNSSLNTNPAEQQIRRYMERNNISRLTLVNGKLKIEYIGSSVKVEKEINSEDLKTIQNYLKEHNNSVNYEQLKFNSPATNQDKKPDYIPWIVGGGILSLVVIFVYWIIRKSKRLPNK